jgi:hypothetical protein
MLTLSKPHQILIGAVLTLLLVATRGHHVASMVSLPSASLTVFFLAGIYLRPAWAPAVLLAICAWLDYSAITVGGVSSFCVTPAYGFLLPAYGVMWLAGRLFAKHINLSTTALLPLTGFLLLGAFVSELFSSGGFYFFGGRFAETSFVEFGSRFVKYFPHQLQGLAFWVGIAVVVHIAIVLTNNSRQAKA